MCYCDKYANLGKEKKTTDLSFAVAPKKKKKKFQTRNKVMGSTTGFSVGVNQHRAALISWFLFTSAGDLANIQNP